MKNLLFLVLLILIIGCTLNNETGNNTLVNNDSLQENNSVASAVDDTINALNDSVIDSLVNLTVWTDNELSLSVPAGWVVRVYGDCATKSFIAYDLSNPVRQVFYFSEAGPVYVSQVQKDNDLAWKEYYASINASYAIYWTDAPVINPLSAVNFLVNFNGLAESYVMLTVAPGAPRLSDVEVISSSEPSSRILPDSLDAKVIRANFRQGSDYGDGLFYVETVNFSYMGIGYGLAFIGLSAEAGEFNVYESVLNSVISSYELSNDYVSACIQAQKQALSGALKAGQVLSETSDIILSSYDSRQRSDDITSEKWSDSMLGYERLYNPETDEVYRVNNGFYDSYNINRDNFRMSNLEVLPGNDWDLWTSSTYSQEDIK